MLRFTKYRNEVITEIELCKHSYSISTALPYIVASAVMNKAICFYIIIASWFVYVYLLI